MSSSKVETFFTGDHEEVVFFNDPGIGLKCIIAIHNTQLGPSLGGVRMWKYENADLALEEVDVGALLGGLADRARLDPLVQGHEVRRDPTASGAGLRVIADGALLKRAL